VPDVRVHAHATLHPRWTGGAGQQSEKIIRAAKRETAAALWRTELAPRDPKVTALAIAFVESYGGPPLAHQAHLTSTQLPRARQAATAN
jgi:hypothetical protein